MTALWRINLIRALSLILLAAGSFQATWAHDCFLFANPFRAKAGSTTKIAIHIHDQFPGQHAKWARSRILRFEHHVGSEKSDAIETKPAPDSSGVLLRLEKSGVHLFALDWASRLIEIKAADFTKYLKSEGLDQIVDARTERGDAEKAGRERYSRYIKTLVHAGDGDDAAVSAVLGQTIELVPVDNPYKKKVGGTVRFRLLFRGTPLPNALIAATYDGHSRTAHKYAFSARTDADGVVSIPLSQKGAWLVRTVHMLPAQGEKEFDWESWWASVTFDVR